MVERVAGNEGLEVEDQVVRELYRISEGDLRKVLNVLQTASVYSKRITVDLVYRVAGLAAGIEARRMMELALSGNLTEARKLLRQALYVDGVSEREIVSRMYSELFYLPVPEAEKARLFSLLGEVDYRLSQGATPEVQLMMVLSALYALSSKRS